MNTLTSPFDQALVMISNTAIKQGAMAEEFAQLQIVSVY